ncbi:alkaline phosphatase [Blastococcus sp. TF02A-26]|uniref:alkaline phosphatase D family protein n=1 Tax=Blastococcus sp. TF02A-26 TaxID=2250577 RepID=UPI000DEBF397|nr:alkaline phosphatase D family protein [Blastococcus sp. TF02A-26]RBY81846.1 alkaline phosphatase [Blastococcus sp. TF02A-26]
MSTPGPAALALSRRTVLKGGLAAAAFTFLGGCTSDEAREQVDQTARSGVFAFGVASGDPTATEVLLWTRVTPTEEATPGSGRGPEVTVEWEVAADEDFNDIVASGEARTDASRDHTVKVVVEDLETYTRYFYRFRYEGSTSPVGRTQTSPDEPGTTHALRLAFASCSNYTGGYFTAYRGIAARDDLDFVLHLGDYVYEYGNGPEEAGATGDGERYGPPELVGVRDVQPLTETVSLEDYRLRHALYKSDPDLQAAHLRFPWITILDDHEVTNDAYATGAENHEEQDDPQTEYTGPGAAEGVFPEGDFLARREAAYQAYFEWMPIREPETWQPEDHQGTQFFRRFTFGDLAELSVIETRQNRSQQVPAVVDGVANPALADPERHLPEPEQMAWLTSGLQSGRTAWHLVGNQTVVARVYSPFAPATVFSADQWDGYQADQATLLEAMAGSGDTDPVVLTGDIHSSWANDLPRDLTAYPADGNSVGVEFVCPSVTSDGFKETLGSVETANAAIAAGQALNPWVRYLEGVGHGFAVLDVTPERVQTDFWFIQSGGDKGLSTDPRLDPDATVGFEAAWQSVKGSRKVTPAAGELGARSDEPRSA